jgi:hypothetical protein
MRAILKNTAHRASVRDRKIYPSNRVSITLDVQLSAVWKKPYAALAGGSASTE